MRRYNDVVEVTRGRVEGIEAPEAFRWRGRLWRVRAVLAHWVETGAWWQSPADGAGVARPWDDLLAEQERWRVEGVRDAPEDRTGVFDLALDWSDGRWRLVGCTD